MWANLLNLRSFFAGKEGDDGQDRGFPLLRPTRNAFYSEGLDTDSRIQNLIARRRKCAEMKAQLRGLSTLEDE